LTVLKPKLVVTFRLDNKLLRKNDDR